jgi:predicted RNA-binding protein with EMAP domain
MMMLDSMDELLTHIKEVQLDVIELSGESLMKMSSFIEKNKIEIDEDISTALQYQDIITQQLHATIEAIESMQSSINMFSHAYKSDEGLAEQSIAKLQEKLHATLQDAKDKKSRFSGKVSESHADDEIEFF